MDRTFERLARVLVKRTPTYFDELVSLGAADAEAIRDLEANFIIATLRCRRYGRVPWLSTRSVIVLKRFIEGRQNPARLLSERHFVVATKESSGFIFHSILRRTPIDLPDAINLSSIPTDLSI